MRVAVIGSTGYIGGRLVPELLDAGHTVRCLARDPNRLDGIDWEPRVELATADVLDFDSMCAALEDVDTIYLVTEGNPTEGRFIDLDRFVRHMMRTQKFTKTEVNSLFIGNARSAVRYLERVSEPTGGRFHDVSNTGR